MAIKTRAQLSEDGKHYILNGAKQWISNAGFADLMVVFAKIDDSKHTAFIVESAWPGVSTGAEERKMGIKGSSTRTVYFDNVKVPVENVLGEIGKGYKIAFTSSTSGASSSAWAPPAARSPLCRWPRSTPVSAKRLAARCTASA
jgi:alkylation response protein AidB-like acyl-CoA dehydrogenase